MLIDSESESDGGWISWFCDLEGHEFFVEVSNDWMERGLVWAQPICNTVWVSLGGRGLPKRLV